MREILLQFRRNNETYSQKYIRIEICSRPVNGRLVLQVGHVHNLRREKEFVHIKGLREWKCKQKMRKGPGNMMLPTCRKSLFSKKARATFFFECQSDRVAED